MSPPPPTMNARNILAAITLLALLFTLYIYNNHNYAPILTLFTPWPVLSDADGPSPPHTATSMRLKHVFHHNIEGEITTLGHGRFDVPEDVFMQDDSEMTILGTSRAIPRLKDHSVEAIGDYFAQQHSLILNDRPASEIPLEAWHREEMVVPDIEDRRTIITLATMSSNAYVLPGEIDWRNVTDDNNYNTSFGVGWETPGVRGHVFLSKDNKTVVLALKGTSAAVFDSGGETTPLDKLNDNLLFSCCCARVSYLWTPVCDCFQGSAYTCDGLCLEKELIRKDRYYKATLNIYKDLLKLYPKHNIWVTGHSLGGALASLLARTYAIPAVSFEAPGDLLASKRLHLPFPPGILPGEEYIWQFGHTADPIYMGVCNGVGSTCSIGGYAMESACHSGLKCVYDVVSDKGWHVNMLNHRIHTVIDEILWDYDSPARCDIPEVCVDCFNWRFDQPEKPEKSEKPKHPEKPKSVSSSSKMSSKSGNNESTFTSTKSTDKLTKTSTARTVKTTATTTTTMTATTTIPRTSPTSKVPAPSCLGRNWFGSCTKYASVSIS